MGGGISGVGSVNYTFAKQNEPDIKKPISVEINGVKNTDETPARLCIKQASVTDILSFISSNNVNWRDNCTFKVINNNKAEVINAAPQRSDDLTAGEAQNSSGDAAFKQALGKALSELPSDEGFISQKQNDAKQDLINDYKERNEEKKIQKFISMISNFSGHEEHRAVSCVNDFLMIRKEIKDSLPPEDSAKKNELDKLTAKFISTISKSGLGINSLAAGSMKSSEAKLNEFRRICNRLVGLSCIDNGKPDLTFNHQIADKVATVLSNSGLSDEQQKQVLDKSSDLFRASLAEHTDMHSSISGAPLSLFEQVQNKLHHEAIIFSLIDSQLSKLMDEAPAANNDVKNAGPAAGPDTASQPSQIINNYTIDNSIHNNINHWMNPGQPLSTDMDNINVEKAPVAHTLSQTESIPNHHSQLAQTETEYKSGAGTQAGDGIDAPVIEEPFTRQFAKVNTATIPSIRPEEAAGIDITPVDDIQDPQPAVIPATAFSANTAGKESQTVSQEEPVTQPAQTAAARPDTQAAKDNVDKGTPAGREQLEGVEPETRATAQQTTKTVKHPTVDASTSYFGSPGSSGARSTPSDAARNRAGVGTGSGVASGTQTGGVTPQTTSGRLGAQPAKANTDKGISVDREQLAAVKPEVRSVAQQTAMAVKHPTVDASTSYFGSPGSSGARSTPSDAVRNSVSAGTDAGRRAQANAGFLPGVDSGNGTNRAAQPLAAGMQAPVEVRSRTGERAVLQPSPLRHYARVQPAVQNEPMGAAARNTLRTEHISQTSASRTAVTQQVISNTLVSNEKSAKYPPVDSAKSYFGSPGSSGARSVPSEAAHGNAGTERGTQTTGGQSAKASVQTQADTQAPQPAMGQQVSGDAGLKFGVQSRIGQHAMLETSPLINSARVQQTVQKTAVEPAMSNIVHHNAKPEINTEGATGAKHQPAKKYPPVNTASGYLGSPGSSGARSVPSEFARARNLVSGAASPVTQGKTSVAPQTAQVRKPVGAQNSAMAGNQPRGESGEDISTQGTANQPAKKYPPVGTASGYIGSPGSSAARSVPSNFAQSSQKAEVIGAKTNGGSIGTSQSREASQRLGTKDTTSNANRPNAERRQSADISPQQAIAAPGNNVQKQQVTVAAPQDASVEKAANKQWGPTYMDKQNKGYIGSRGSAQATPFFNGPVNKK